MNGYSIEFARAVRRELERLPTKVVDRVMRAVRRLRDNPRPRGCRKLTGDEATYRIRIGDYRVVYEIGDETRSILVTRVRHRKDAYQ